MPQHSVRFDDNTAWLSLGQIEPDIKKHSRGAA